MSCRNSPYVSLDPVSVRGWENVMKHRMSLLIFIMSVLPVPALAASVHDVDDEVPDGETALYKICNTLYGTKFAKNGDMSAIEVNEAEVCVLHSGYVMDVCARARFSQNSQECGYYTPVGETGPTDLKLGQTHTVTQYNNTIFDDLWYEEMEYPPEMMWTSEEDQNFPSDRPLSIGIYSRVPAEEGTRWFSEASSLRDGRDHLLVFLIEELHDGNWARWTYLLAFEDPPGQGDEINDFNDSLLEVVVEGSGVTGKMRPLNAANGGGYGEFDPFSAAHAGADQSKPTGQKVTLDGSNSHAATVSWDWDFDTKPAGSSAVLKNATTVNPDFTSDKGGLYKLWLKVYDGAVWSVEDYVNVTASTSSPVYVDFAYSGTEAGTSGQPFNTLAEGILGVTAGGTIKIKGNTGDNDTDETPRITKAMRIQADPAGASGVRIGVLVAKMKTAPHLVTPAGASDGTEGTGTSAERLDAINMALALAGNEEYAAEAGKDKSTLVADRTTFEPVLPFTQSAQADSVLAVRLRSDAAIDPASIWGPVPNYTENEATAEWQPVAEGDMRDIWVIFRPQDTWYLDEVISLTVGARTVAGEQVEPVTYEFQTESVEEYWARVADPVEPMWQPEYDQDFDADGLDLAAESNDTAVVTTADGQTDAGPLEDGIEEPYVIGPEQVYDVPQRVWLPVPRNVNPTAVRLYYYHATGQDRGWYPAENVEGWLVPDSYLELDLENVTYLGFLVRHAGIVQLRIATERNEQTR